MSGSSRWRFKVYYKIIVPFLLVVLLGIATTIPIGIRLVNQLNQSRIDQELRAIARVVSNYIGLREDELLAYTQTMIQNEAVSRAVAAGDEVELRRILLPLKTRLRIGFLAAYGSDGRCILHMGPEEVTPLLDDSDTLRKARLGINIKSLEIRPGGVLLLAGVPNETSRGMAGALVAGYELDRDFLRGIEEMVGHPVALLSAANRLVVATEAPLAEALRGRLPDIRTGVSTFLDYQGDDGPQRVKITDLLVYNSPRAHVAVASPMKEVIAFRNRIISYILLLSTLGSLAVLMMGMLVARAINNPIRRLLTLTQEVRRGNFDVQTDLITRDEVGELALSFNQMVAGLRENMLEIQSSRGKIAKYAHELEQYSLQLQRDKQEIEAVLNNMRDGLLMVDRQGIILAINPEAARLLGRESRDCLGQELGGVLAPLIERSLSRETLLSAIEFAREESREEEQVEFVLGTPHKTIYRLKFHPVLGEANALIGRLLLFSNITREKEIEEMKNNFLATISHELRTPLTSIKGSLNLLLDGNLGFLTADQREFIKIANNNSERLAALVNNLLDLARMEAGEFRTRKTVCDLVSLTKKALSDIKAQAVGKDVKLLFGAAIMAAPVMGDPERIIQLVSNLIDNAIKFSLEGGRVSVNLSEFTLEVVTATSRHLAGLSRGLYFQVQVTDRGKGIPPDQLEKIFDKFHQADMSSTRQAGGSGLGLAIARTIAREHGGAVWAENLPEGGSRFSFLLPRAPVEWRSTATIP